MKPKTFHAIPHRMISTLSIEVPGKPSSWNVTIEEQERETWNTTFKLKP
jgi:hypothetical protein